MRFTERDATVHVFVWKEGVAKAVGHDIQVAVRRFTIDVDVTARSVTAQFDAASLATLGAIVDDELDEAALSRGDLATIDRSIAHDVLDATRFPAITFASTRFEGARVEGTLTLKGVARTLSFDVVAGARTTTADVVLDQTAFGIEPFKAFFGALKVKPNVLVRVELPLVLGR